LLSFSAFKIEVNPDFPANKLSQQLIPIPNGVTKPTPVITTLLCQKKKKKIEALKKLVVKMSTTRTIADIEADIATVRKTNPNWCTDSGDKVLIAALINEKNSLSQAQQVPQAPGNFVKSCEFIELFPSHFSYLYFILLLMNLI
jgi:hypothetical protein